MQTISSHTFKYTLRDIHKKTESRKFCFILGAGASFSSGIPTGGELASLWFKEIQDRYSKQEFTQWVKAEKINKQDLAADYGAI